MSTRDAVSAVMALLLACAATLPVTSAPASAGESPRPLVVLGDDHLPPYEFLEDGVPRGFNVELWQALASVLGRPVDLRLGDWAAAQAAVREGKADALSILGVTPERRAIYGFTQSTFPFSYSLFVRTADADRFATVPIESRRIGVTTGGLPRSFFERNHPAAPLVFVNDTVEGIRRLLREDIDAFAAVTWTGNYFLHELQITGITPLPVPFATRDSGIAVPLDNPALLAELDQALTVLKRDGRFDRIIARWSFERVHVFTERELWLGGAVVAVSALLAGALGITLALVRRKQRALGREIAGHEQTQAALQRERQFLQDVQEQRRVLTERLMLAARAGGIGVWEWNVETDSHIWDARMFELYAVRPEEGAPSYALWRGRVHPDDLPEIEGLLQNAIDHGLTGYESEFRIVTPTDETRTLKTSGLLERDAGGRLQKVVGINWDISEARATARELEAARRRAEDASHAKSAFVANMSHEIRTPLNAITGMLYLLHQSGLSGRQADYVGKMQSAAGMLMTIINDILDFSKIESGRLDLEYIPFSLSEVIDRLVDVINESARGKDIEVVIRVAPGLPDALAGDPTRLGQILLNLATNAVKFTERGEVTVTIEAAEVTGPFGGCDGAGIPGPMIGLRCEVRDTGIGMARAQLERLFTLFSQGDVSMGRRFGGSGLGLTIARRLVELMGGRLEMASTLNVGTVCTFTIRLGRAADRLTAPAVQIRQLAGLRALVADDHPGSRRVLTELLAGFGMRTTEAGDGPEALAAWTRAADSGVAPYDVLLVDWKMPVLDGPATIRAIREQARRPAPPAILMVTEFGRERVRAQAEVSGVAALLRKPVTGSALMDALSIALGFERARRRGADPGGHQPVQDRPGDGLRGRRALLVEDNPINQQIAQEILEAAGLSVEVAATGRQAVQRLAGPAHGIDVVLMDLHMPVMDGYAAARLIRGLPSNAGLPIIAMTADAMAQDRERCLAAGMNDHIAKPIDVGQLFTTLARWLRGPGAAPSGASTEPQGTPVAAAAVAAADDGASLPARLPGLEVAQGLARVGGRVALYRRLLDTFAERNRDDGARIRTAFETGEREAALRVAHSLKGVAANLGAASLSAAAAALEARLREDNQADIGDLIPVIEQHLDQVVATIRRLDRQPPAVPPPAETQPLVRSPVGERHPMLSELREALKAQSLDGIRIWETHLMPGLRADMTPQQLDTLDSAIQTLDFPRALEILDTLVAAA